MILSRLSPIRMAAPWLGLFGVLALGASCSLINSFDEVKTSGPGSGGGGGSGDPGPGPGGGGSTASGPETGGGGSGASGPAGVLVVTGNVGAVTGPRVFVTLDPKDGHELQRYDIAAAAVAYDEATDLWYVFEADNAPPFPDSPMALRVGQINPYTGIFTELHKLDSIPVLRDAQTIKMLNHRIVYRAYDPAFNDTDHIGLGVLDTSGEAPAVAGFGGFISVDPFFSLIPTRSDGGDGGIVNMILKGTCATTCQILRQPVTLPPNPDNIPGVGDPTLGANAPYPPNGGAISAASASRIKGSAEDVLVWPGEAGAPSTIRFFSPSSSVSLDEMEFTASDPPGSEQYFTAVIDECDDVLITSELSSRIIYAVSLKNQKVGVTSLTTPAPVLAYEPYTRTVIAPLRIEGIPLQAFTLSSDGSGKPSLAKRSGADWAPPSDIVPDGVTPRRLFEPTTAECSKL